MAVHEVQADGSHEGVGVDVLISRQPVIDGEMRVIGYRVAYATQEAGNLTPARDLPASRLLGDVLNTVGLEDLVGSSRAHVMVSSELLLAVGTPPVTPDRVVFRVSQQTAKDPRLEPVLEALAGDGYALALDAAPDFGFDPVPLDVFRTVEVDFLVWDEFAAAAAVPRIAAAGCKALAAGLLNYSEFTLAKALGFELFTGPFFASPQVSTGRQVPAGSLGTLASLARLQGDASIDELEQVIDHDLGLSVKLLRYINSAYFGVRSQIASIRQAVMMLGPRAVARWALLTALTGGPTTPRELAVMALTRARMCEQLGEDGADRDELFMIGLLSVADALLGLPLETIVAQLPLAEDVAQALVWHAGPAGSILDATVAFERGDFSAEGLQPYRSAAAAEYREALRLARESISLLV
jgi:EAL and modified HD-GYP domain-containing signal transduction protein